MTLRLRSRKLGLARKAYRLVRFKQDVDDLRSIEADYKAALLAAYLAWVLALARALKKVADKDLRRIIVVESVEKLQDTLKKLGEEYLTKSFEVGKGPKPPPAVGWEPDEEALDAMLEEAIAENDYNLVMSLAPGLLGTAEGLFEKPEEFATQASVREQLMARAYQVGLYAGAAWTIFWKGHVEARPPETSYVWKGMDDDALCPGCEPRLGQVYTKQTLPGFPGDGSTPCLMNCRCWLEEILVFAELYPWPVEGEPGHSLDLDEAWANIPEKDRKLKNFKPIQIRDPNIMKGYGRAAGYYIPYQNQIFLDKVWAGTGEFMHEYGHAVWYGRLDQPGRKFFLKVWNQRSGPYRRTGLSFSAKEFRASTKKQISGYAWKNDHELYAESYRFYHLGEHARFDGCPEILEWMRGEYES